MRNRKDTLLIAAGVVLASGAVALPALAGSDGATVTPAPGAAPDTTVGQVKPVDELVPLSAEEQRRAEADLERFVECMEARGFKLGDPEIGPTVAAVDLEGPKGAAFGAATERCGGPGGAEPIQGA